MAIGNTFQIEMETFDLLSGFKVASNSVASGGAYLQAGGSGEQRASYTFAAVSGSYDLGIGYFDESDGQSQISILVNGTEIQNFVWDIDAGGSTANQTSFVEHAI
ncbi:hypothetical protein, partial [Parasedimentitalea psychrophila]